MLPRATLFCSLAVALLCAPGAARADQGMCAVLDEAAFEVGSFDSVDPALLETADPATVVDTAAIAHDAHDVPSAPRLLCSSGNDPRCSPLEASDTPVSPDMPARIDGAPHDGIRVPPVPLRRVQFGEGALMGPSFGPARSLDRPPRA